ncbi:MAG: hypothetical protein ACPLPR_06105 [Bacillota bacterium]
MKPRCKLAAAAVVVLAMLCLALHQALFLGYPHDIPKPPLSYRIKQLLGGGPSYTTERRLPDGTLTRVASFGEVLPDRQAMAAKRAVSTIKPENLQAVRAIVRQLHFQMNDLVCWGHYRRFKDDADYLWGERLRQYVEGKSEMNLTALARNAATNVESPALKRDLEAFVRALEVAYERRDIKLLILAHRLIHDIDYWVFDGETFESRDYWGVTVTLEGN